MHLIFFIYWPQETGFSVALFLSARVDQAGSNAKKEPSCNLCRREFYKRDRLVANIWLLLLPESAPRLRGVPTSPREIRSKLFQVVLPSLFVVCPKPSDFTVKFCNPLKKTQVWRRQDGKL
jgi:hypothetical protein